MEPGLMSFARFIHGNLYLLGVFKILEERELHSSVARLTSAGKEEGIVPVAFILRKYWSRF